MSEKKKKQTKITSGAPNGQADDAAAVQHVKKERDEAKAKDENKMHGTHTQDQPQPKKKKADEPKSSGNIVKSTLLFIKDVIKEAKKITWPPRSQVINETMSVIVLVTMITVMVLGFDYVLGNWVFGPIEHFAKVMAPQSTDQPLFNTAPGEPVPPPADVPVNVPPPGAPQTTPGAPAPVAPATTTPAPTPAPTATTPASTTTTPPAAPTAPQGITAPVAPPTPAPAPQAPSTPTTPRP